MPTYGSGYALACGALDCPVCGDPNYVEPEDDDKPTCPDCGAALVHKYGVYARGEEGGYYECSNEECGYWR
jgi:ssDNA-binding Zn-finger/Zn-ribbon topoisomerase 1